MTFPSFQSVFQPSKSTQQHQPKSTNKIGSISIDLANRTDRQNYLNTFGPSSAAFPASNGPGTHISLTTPNSGHPNLQ
ncbi:hypothetical protein G7K_0300-t1 [Saitoella complicata NRRL Y-17804]|uniref:Uncharacterized protein n=1 Tax=Saitoella complicata (strain BCRC 22490 / CBS 7301 / JCM 7358 / NBRC 10748 / NRRL Y-17804) TaxID=698492 RepID=A0A0E9N818_SAICN|nr:hypothetical protein G7K_0300-t1 [Saitoella complicata NRRL Y-17804]